MEDFSIESVVDVANQYFPFVTQSNFNDLFKLSPLQVANHLKTKHFLTIRNFLILLHWCRHYSPMVALAVYFNVSTSQVSRILKEETDELYQKIREHVNLKEIEIFEKFFLPNCVGVVDSTEVEVNCWIGDSFSGKKHAHTLKYQVICCLITRKPIQIIGPFFGKESDASVWKKSGMGEYLENNDLWVLGDKGYQGCLRVKHCLKKKRGHDTLDPASKEYNRKISTKRVEIENHFAEVKKWKVVSHVYRGNLDDHVKIYFTCEILTILSKS